MAISSSISSSNDTKPVINHDVNTGNIETVPNVTKSISHDQTPHPIVMVAIPAYNEEIAIGSVVARCKKFTDTVVVVDDGSKDHTVEVARLVGAEVVSHKLNRGYGAAIKTCFEQAKSRNADILVIIDGDGQHDPDDIPVLVGELLNHHADILIGSRFVNGNGQKQKIPYYRKAGMKVLDRATALGTGLSILDSQSGFRAYSRNAISSIKFDNTGMAAGSEILIQAADKNLKIMEMPILVRYDIKKSTSSEHPVSHGLSVLTGIIRLISQKRPLLFFCVPGSISLIIGAIFSLRVLDIYDTTKRFAIGSEFIGTLCIMVGLFSIFTGLTLASIQSMKNKH